MSRKELHNLASTQASLSDGRVYLSAAALKNRRRQLGFSQMGLAEYAASMRLPISIASIKRAELGKPVIYRTALQLARLFKEDLAKLIVDAEPLDASLSPPPAMGREGELNYIRYLLAATHIQRIGKFIYIRGVAGVGKSRMLQALSQSAAQDNFHVAQCKLQDLTLAGDIHLWISSLLGLAPTASDTAFAATQNSHFMVVIDDVHEASEPILELLAQLVGHTRHLPVAWLMASRPENDPLEAKLRPLLGDQTIHIVDIAPELAQVSNAAATQADTLLNGQPSTLRINTNLIPF